jgi:hypothetical protein
VKVLTKAASLGVSLIELVYALAMLAILAAVLVPLALNGLRAYQATRIEVSQLDQLRYATERLAREIREVRYSSESEAAFHVFTPTSVAFTRTLRDAAGSEVSERVTVALADSRLMLGYDSLAGVGSQMLLGSVKNLSFVGLDGLQQAMVWTNPPSAGQLAAVHAVRIELEVQGTDGLTRTRQTTVQLKNRRLS